ncbi:hypothetical protein ABIB99_008901 [Bradyrhizobium sp. LA6.1]|uniref:hypothetical protein n=1 Tax=Bradyrhizobium sp. LA6.1 TaxID=3156378 RepID=UPI003394A70A
MARSRSRDCPLAKELKVRFDASRPTQELFVSRIAEYFRQLPTKLRGRKNRTVELHSFRKDARRWLEGAVPQRNMRPAIAKALEESEEHVARLCASQRAQPVSSIYRFASPPIAVIAAWPLGDDTFAPHSDDQQAFAMLLRDINTAMDAGLSTPMLSTELGCPTSYTHRDLILISGPNNNPLATQLNSFIAKSDLSAFYFALENDISTPDLPNKWLITHTKIGLRVDLSREQSRANNKDYGIIYVGNNPESSEHYLIWLAGLHSRGTIGAARAFFEPEVRTHILREFSRGKKYVSAVVRFDYPRSCMPECSRLVCVMLRASATRTRKHSDSLSFQHAGQSNSRQHYHSAPSDQTRPKRRGETLGIYKKKDLGPAFERSEDLCVPHGAVTSNAGSENSTTDVPFDVISTPREDSPHAGHTIKEQFRDVVASVEEIGVSGVLQIARLAVGLLLDQSRHHGADGAFIEEMVRRQRFFDFEGGCGMHKLEDRYIELRANRCRLSTGNNPTSEIVQDPESGTRLIVAGRIMARRGNQGYRVPRLQYLPHFCGHLCRHAFSVDQTGADGVGNCRGQRRAAC